jgi:ATP-binding cassette subfamily C protein
VLDDVSLEIPAGRLTALVGPSGAGKTSVADLVIGLVRPSRGAVLVDGVPLGRIDLRRWRSWIGYVPQELFLLHDTVFVNVTLGDPDLGPADVWRALREAGAAEFVERLPQGLDTVVGERGSLLSGGQRQRIAIARALVRRPRLLLLDEATTALDPETEAAVCASVARLRGEMTILAISHEPALVEMADRVWRIENGAAKRVDGREPAE